MDAFVKRGIFHMCKMMGSSASELEMLPACNWRGRAQQARLFRVLFRVSRDNSCQKVR